MHYNISSVRLERKRCRLPVKTRNIFQDFSSIRLMKTETYSRFHTLKWPCVIIFYLFCLIFISDNRLRESFTFHAFFPSKLHFEILVSCLISCERSLHFQSINKWHNKTRLIYVVSVCHVLMYHWRSAFFLLGSSIKIMGCISFAYSLTQPCSYNLCFFLYFILEFCCYAYRTLG